MPVKPETKGESLLLPTRHTFLSRLKDLGDSGLAVKVFDGVAVTNPALPLTDFKMVITGGTALYAIDDLIIEQLAPFADSEIALEGPFVGDRNISIEPMGPPNSTWSVWRAMTSAGPWANAGSLTLDETGTGQYLTPIRHRVRPSIISSLRHERLLL